MKKYILLIFIHFVQLRPLSGQKLHFSRTNSNIRSEYRRKKKIGKFFPDAFNLKTGEIFTFAICYLLI